MLIEVFQRNWIRYLLMVLCRYLICLFAKDYNTNSRSMYVYSSTLAEFTFWQNLVEETK